MVPPLAENLLYEIFFVRACLGQILYFQSGLRSHLFRPLPNHLVQRLRPPGEILDQQIVRIEVVGHPLRVADLGKHALENEPVKTVDHPTDLIRIALR
jgi:hypothetical protein